MKVEFNSPLTLCVKFNMPMVDVFTSQTNPKPSLQNCAFTKMMQASSQRKVPKKCANPGTNYEHTYNEVIDHLEKANVTWSASAVNETGELFVKTLRAALWYITCHHSQFVERAAHLPAFVTEKFGNRDDYEAKHKARPKLENKRLIEHINQILPFMDHPWMNRGQAIPFKKDMDKLIEAMKKVSEWKSAKSSAQKDKHHKQNVVREISDNIQITIIPPSDADLNQSAKYERVADELSKMEMYKPMHLTAYEPKDRYNQKIFLAKSSMKLLV